MEDQGEQTTLALLRELRGGDEQAVSRLYERYRVPLQRWARGRLPGWARGVMDTGDLVQDVLVLSLDHAAEFDYERPGAFLAYLRQGVLNRIRNEIRRASRKPSADVTLGGVADSAPSPLEQAIGSELLGRYEAGLNSLPEDAREAVVARVELGMSYDEIARSLGKPSADAARMTVSRALLRLAEAMRGGRD